MSLFLRVKMQTYLRVSENVFRQRTIVLVRLNLSDQLMVKFFTWPVLYTVARQILNYNWHRQRRWFKDDFLLLRFER